jgi:hypothetical protein
MTGAPRPAGSPPQIKFDASVLSQTDRIIGVSTLVLFISLFLPWFRVHFGFGTVTGSGLTVHGYLYIPLIVSIFIILLMVAEALGVWKLPAQAAANRTTLLLIATVINFVLVLIGFLDKPGGSGVGWDWGAFVGLVAAVFAAFPHAWPLIQGRIAARKK